MEKISIISGIKQNKKSFTRKPVLIKAFFRETTKLVIERLENGELLEKEQINPIDAVIAKAAYDFGSDPKRKLKWDNNEKVLTDSCISCF